MDNTPLTVLDLVPVSSGATAADAIRNSIDLTRQTERFGYARYWFAEHHLNPGTASTSPAVLLALAASATSTMRIGSGAVLLGHRTALATVEEFGLLDALHPGRIDLGLGNTSGRGKASSPPASSPIEQGDRIVDGLRIPSQARTWPRMAQLINSPLATVGRELLHAPHATVPDYGGQVGDILDMLAGRYSRGGLTPQIVPGTGARPQIWIMGATAGQSAKVAGEYGLRFAVGYHAIPATVLDTVAAYHAAFRPSAELDRPYLCVSADVVVAPDQDTARRLASGYGPWVHSIRSGCGAMPFPTTEEAESYAWTTEDRDMVADRIDTQFVGSPAEVADQLEVLRDVTGADELIITTVTHDHADRVRSYQLLAEEWSKRAVQA